MLLKKFIYLRIKLVGMLQHKKIFPFKKILLLLLSVLLLTCKKDHGVLQDNNTSSTQTITGNWISISSSVSGILFTKDSFMFAGGGKIYRTSDNGNNWTSVNSFPGNYFLVNGNNIYFGMADGNSSVYMSNNNGNNWSLIGSNMGNSVYSLASIGNTLYVGTACGVHMTVDNGIHWMNIYSGFPTNTSSYPYLPAGTLAVKDTNLFAGTAKGLYLYSQYNSTWSSVMCNGLPTGAIIKYLAVNGNTLFAGTWQNGIYYSNDNGVNWFAINNGLPKNGAQYCQVQSISIFGNYIFSSLQGHIYLTTDNGNTWSLLTGFSGTNPAQSSIILKDSILFCAGANVIDPNPDHPYSIPQIWKCSINSLH